MSSNFCPHIVKAKEAMKNNKFASTVSIDVVNVVNKISDDSLEESLLDESSDGALTVFLLPGDIVAIPIFNIFATIKSEPFVHVKDFKCSLEVCLKKSKKHTLIQKGVPLCIHSMLVHFLPKKGVATKKDVEHQIDYLLTVKTIMSKVRDKFPPSYKCLMKSDFLKNSRSFVDSLLSSPKKLEEVLKNVPHKCEFCGDLLKDWKHKGRPHNLKCFYYMAQFLSKIIILLHELGKCKKLINIKI